MTGVAGFIGSHLVEALLARGHRVVGVDRRPVCGDRRCESRPRPPADELRVLRVSTNQGDVIIKWHRNRTRYERERAAYRSWAPVLGEQTPALLAAVDKAPALIITALPGAALVDVHLDASAQRDVFAQAGRLLAAWHRIEPPRHTLDMAGWLADRGARWLHLAESILPAARRVEIRAHLRALTTLGPLATTPCHLDFTPRNLMWTPDRAVSVLDFEHARHDLPARDLVRLATRSWPSRPDLRDAFLSGYGQLSDLDEQVIEHCTHLDALTVAVRATGRCLPVAAPIPVTG